MEKHNNAHLCTYLGKNKNGENSHRLTLVDNGLCDILHRLNECGHITFSSCIGKTDPYTLPYVSFNKNFNFLKEILLKLEANKIVPVNSGFTLSRVTDLGLPCQTHFKLVGGISEYEHFKKLRFTSDGTGIRITAHNGDLDSGAGTLLQLLTIILDEEVINEKA